MILQLNWNKWVIMIVHLSDCDNDTVLDYLVDRDLFVFDSFFDEEDAFLVWSRAIAKWRYGGLWGIVGVMWKF